MADSCLPIIASVLIGLFISAFWLTYAAFCVAYHLKDIAFQMGLIAELMDKKYYSEQRIL